MKTTGVILPAYADQVGKSLVAIATSADSEFDSLAAPIAAEQVNAIVIA